MGNTNLPQFGAADTPNSRDTLDGDQQLTEDQKEQRDRQAEGGLDALLPDSVANESRRVVEHVDGRKDVIAKPSPKPAEESIESGKSADLPPTEADREALAGHVGTGHSPADAT